LIDSHERANWDRMADWRDEHARAYYAAYERMLG
jgi:hypothetical protein